MRPLTNAQAYAIAVATGAGSWIAVTMISGRREAWDSPLYWMAGYPAGIGIVGILALPGTAVAAIAAAARRRALS